MILLFSISAAYISLTTVKLEVSGRVSFCSVPDDHVIEGVYLAPELQQQGVVTEKTCLFGIAAMLWNAADYKLPTNQEPNLTTELENMLISMTNEDTDIRPSASDVLQVQYRLRDNLQIIQNVDLLISIKHAIYLDMFLNQNKKQIKHELMQCNHDTKGINNLNLV